MLWERTKEVLQQRIDPDLFELWIEPLVCSREEQASIELSGPDRFFCSWVNDKYQQLILDSAAEVNGDPVAVLIQEAPAMLPPQPDSVQLRLPAMPAVEQRVRALHPRFSFDEFMVGESNALAYTACRTFAGGDDALGNCLYVHSGSGLGKSHLTQAVARHVFTSAPTVRLHYLSAQQFSAEMVHGIKTNTMDTFKTKYTSSCDLLLLEDIHTLNGKNKTQEELNEILDALMKSGKKVMLTAPLPLAEMKGLDACVCSRMSGGLRTVIEPPDLATRKQILRRKAENNKLDLAPSQVDFLAGHLRGDVRKLESVVIGIKAKMSLLHQEPDQEMLLEVIRSVAGTVATRLSSMAIRDFVGRQFKLSADLLASRSRRQAIAFPRQIAMYLCRLLTEETLSDIGRAFNRDHSTVLHACKVVIERMARDASVRKQIGLLAMRLKE